MFHVISTDRKQTVSRHFDRPKAGCFPSFRPTEESGEILNFEF